MTRSSSHAGATAPALKHSPRACPRSFIYVFRFFQVILNALMTSTLFFRTTRHPNSINEANYYLGVLFFSLISMLVRPSPSPYTYT